MHVAAGMASLNLSNSPAGVSVKLKPLVLFNICDAYIRRNESQIRVIGTLLGHISDGVVYVQNGYAVPHNESNDQVMIEDPISAARSFCLNHMMAEQHRAEVGTARKAVTVLIYPYEC